MIQRIQSVYLLLVTILMVVTVFSPLFTFGDSNDIYLFMSSGWSVINTELQDNYSVITPIYGIPFIAGLTGLLAFVNIFLYKRRKLQIKIGYITICFLVLLYATIAAYFYSVSQNIQSIEFISIKYGIILPIIAFIINVLAILGIRKDERLIKSLDRIR